MNTKEKWLTTATIHDAHRRDLWGFVFPGAVVPIRSILTCKVNVPGHQNADAYMLDLDAISDEQREGLITVIATRFKIPIEQVRADINQGVPILAEGVSVGTADPGIFFSMIGDDIDFEREEPDDDEDHFEDYDEED